MSIDLRPAAQVALAFKEAKPELAKLKKATEDFEAVFLKKLFSQMRSTVKETQFGQTFGKEIYDDMFNEALANSAAKSKTLGMGDMLYRQMAPKVIQRGMGSLPMRPSTSLVEEAGAVVPDTKEAITSNPVVPDLAGQATHEQVAHATSNSVKHDLAGRATHGQAAHATATPKP